jgi:hypothetical protein
MARMNRQAERNAWTEFVTGQKPQANKFHVAPKEDRGGYASKREMEVATKLHALASGRLINDLREQVRIELIPADPPFKAVVYIADFTYFDLDGKFHVLDAKGVKTAVYQVKKKLLWHTRRIQIEEV